MTFYNLITDFLFSVSAERLKRISRAQHGNKSPERNDVDINTSLSFPSGSHWNFFTRLKKKNMLFSIFI